MDVLDGREHGRAQRVLRGGVLLGGATRLSSRTSTNRSVSINGIRVMLALTSTNIQVGLGSHKLLV